VKRDERQQIDERDGDDAPDEPRQHADRPPIEQRDRRSSAARNVREDLGLMSRAR
jgi:hypothetical protein